jgi:hypothetical protein
VQTLAGVLLPSATVFLLLLCNDPEVLGPWVNSRGINLFSSAVVGVLVTLSIVLTSSVLYPSITSTEIVGIIAVGVVAAALAGLYLVIQSRRVPAARPAVDRAERATWRMPPLALLHAPRLSTTRKVGLGILRIYLLIATILVIVRLVQLAIGN